MDLRQPWPEHASDRFIDPLGFDAGDSNLYRYVNNRPVQATDPSGLQQVFPKIDGGSLEFSPSSPAFRIELKIKNGPNVIPVPVDGIEIKASKFALDFKRQLGNEVVSVIGGYGTQVIGKYQPAKNSDSAYYFAQFAAKKTYVYKFNDAKDPKKWKQVKADSKDWFTDTKDVKSNEPYKYKYQGTLNGNQVMDDKPTFFFGGPTSLDRTGTKFLDGNTKVNVIADEAFSEGVIRGIDLIANDFPDEHFYATYRYFRTYLVKVPAGGVPAPLGYVEWGYSVTLDLSKGMVSPALLEKKWVPFDKTTDGIWGTVKDM